MISKLFDGIFFFLVFKVCFWFWDKYIAREEEEYYTDESGPDYEALNEFQTQGPVLPFIGDPDDSEDLQGWIV